jgi:hypothetical protein
MLSRNVLIAISIAFFASLFIALSSYHNNLNADTMVLYLHSIIKWTPFLWGQDRQGMLVQGLTVWIEDPILNVIVQTVLHNMTAVFAFFLLADFLFPRSSWLWMGSLSLLAFIGLSGTGDLYDFFTPWQNYSVSLMLGLLALRFLPRSRAMSFLLLCLSQWSMFSTNVLLAMLMGLKEFFGRPSKSPFFWPSRETVTGLGLLLASSVVGHILRINAPNSYPSDYSMLPLSEGLWGWTHLLADYFQSARSSNWLIALPAALGAAIFLIGKFQTRSVSKTALWPASNLWQQQWLGCRLGLTTAALYALIVGSSRFASAMGFPRRYLIPSLMIWVVSWVGLLWVLKLNPKGNGQDRSLAAPLAFVVLAVSLVLFRFGSPSYSRVKDLFAQKMQPRYEQIARAQCTHLIGSYYRVWESVFFSRMIKSSPLWGITDRAQATQDLWNLDLFSQPRICHWKDESADAKVFIEMFHLANLAPLESVGDLIVLARAPQK